MTDTSKQLHFLKKSYTWGYLNDTARNCEVIGRNRSRGVHITATKSAQSQPRQPVHLF